MKQRVTELFEKAKTGEFVGKPASIGRLSADGKAYLEKLSGLKFKEFVDFVLNPSDLNHIRSDHYGENEKDKGNNVPLTDEDIQNMVDVLNQPDDILYGVDKKDGRKLFFFLKDAGNGLYNLTEVCSTKKGNLTAKSFFKSKKKGISQRVMEIKDSLLPTSVTYSGEFLSSDAKIPTLFEINKIPGGKVSEDGLLYRKPYGGNSGYVGYSISRRGAEAKAEGRYPKTEFRKEYGITEPSLKALVEAGVIDGGEWHHTSSYGNRTAFYGWSDGNGAEAYIRNKGEIDRLSRVIDKSSKLEAEGQGYGYGDQLDNYVQKLQLEGRYRQMMTPEERSEYRRRQDGVSDSGKPAAERIWLHKELENEYFTEQAKRERAYRDELRESDGFKAFAAEAAERKRQLDEAKRAAGEAKRRIGEIFEKAADEGMKFRDGGMGLDETITRMKAAASQANADNWQSKQEAMKAIGGNLNKLRIVGMQEYFCGSSL